MDGPLIADKQILEYLHELKLIRDERKAINERENKIKEFLFEKCDIQSADCICNPEGTVLATYKQIDQKRFDTETFKDSYPDMYRMYMKTIHIKSLLLKGD
jgi:predicted phage-related endonuclease